MRRAGKAIASVAVLVGSGWVSSVSTAAASGFTDVSESHVFVSDIRWLAGEGISTGYDNGNGSKRFEPSAPVLREQMAAFLYRLAGRPDVDLPPASPFTDVPTNHTFYPEIVWLSRSGVTTGYDNGNGSKRFDPSAPVLREQMAAFLHRFKTDQDGVAPTLPTVGQGFIDVAAAHSFAGQIRWLAGTGITTGYDNGNGTLRFAPSAAVLREQMAAFMSRYANGATVRVSATSTGAQTNGDAGGSAVSGDGRYVVFTSTASNIVSGSPAGVAQVYVRDLGTGAVTRVSRDDAGTAAAGSSYGPSISGDGRYVAFASEATNLVPGDTNHVQDVYLHDRETGTTRRISVSSAGGESTGLSHSPDISADGRYVAFASTAGRDFDENAFHTSEVFLHDIATGQTSLVSEAGYEADYVPDPTNLSFHAAGSPSISGDGRYVAFSSTLLVYPEPSGGPTYPSAVGHVFVHDRVTGKVELASPAFASPGNQNWYDVVQPKISDDGRRVVFSSRSPGLVRGDSNLSNYPDPERGYDVFVRDLDAGTTQRVSVSSSGGQGDRDALWSEISGDGRYVAFASDSTTLVPGDTNGISDMFLRDVATGTTTRINVSTTGAQANGQSGHIPGLSHDGRVIVFGTSANNLVPGDTNNTSDIVVRVRQR